VSSQLVFNIALGISSQSSMTKEVIKGIQIGNEVVKLYLFADNRMLYLKDTKNTIKNS
jgi:hypothetical protein